MDPKCGWIILIATLLIFVSSHNYQVLAIRAKWQPMPANSRDALQYARFAVEARNKEYNSKLKLVSVEKAETVRSRAILHVALNIKTKDGKTEQKYYVMIHDLIENRSKYLVAFVPEFDDE